VSDVFGGDELAAVVIQLADHTERISSLETREDTHHQEVTARLRDLAAGTAATTARIDDVSATVRRTSALVNALTGLDTQVADLARQVADRAAAAGGQDDSYQPVPTPRWWKLTAPDRDSAAGRLHAWVERIYRPGYGKIAAALPACWDRHPFCLYTLDWLSELWSALYLTPRRDTRILAAQAEWQTRLLPAAAEQMAHEAAGCQHSQGPSRQPTAAGRHPSSTRPAR
jgi:hypothetical protein